MTDNQEIYEKHKVLYHYTTKTGLMGILDSQSLWATYYKYLNDTTEIEHMRSTLVGLLTPVAKAVFMEHFRESLKAKERIRKLGGVNAVAEHDAKSIVESYYQTTFGEESGEVPFAEPFITSFCSHGEDNEYIQQNGLLSQWRSYGDEIGVAIVFDTEKLTGLLKHEAKLFHYSIGNFATVVYAGDVDEFRTEFSEFVEDLKGIFLALLRQEEPDMGESLPEFVRSVSRFKHRGFEEEREIRIIVSPATEALREVYQEAGAWDSTDQRKIKEIKFRKSGSTRIPYIELLDFPKKSPLPIIRIIIGPHENQSDLDEEVKRMVDGLDITVHCCETPYIRRR